MAFLCLSFVACFITWKIFFSRNTAGKYLSLDLAISLFFFTLRARQRVLITEYTVFLEVKANLVSITCTMYTIHMFNLFYLFPFVSIVSVSHYHYHYLTISLSILSLSICVNCFCISLLLKIRSCLILLKTVSYFLSQGCRRNFLYLILFIISFIFSSQIYRSLIEIFLDSFFYLVLYLKVFSLYLIIC